ncbi:MAG: DinB family protein [Gemmatimonadaceae bacterium]
MSDYLIRQFDTACALAHIHLGSLTSDECLWRPSDRGLHVRRGTDGRWRAEWPEHEGYGLGPPSIAWLTWHMIFWWSMVIDHSFGDGTLTREEIDWPGSAHGVRSRMGALEDMWRGHLAQLADADLASQARTRWPFTDRPFGDVVAWVNVELTKNAAEIGYARFLYAVRSTAGGLESRL